MKLRAIFITIGILGILSVGMIIGATPGFAGPDLAPQLAQVGTAFTYQGYLEDEGAPANGSYDLRFSLWDDLSVGGQVGSTVTVNAVTVADGIFTVELDFGDVFDGTALWLAIEVQGPGDSSYIPLNPRQSLTAVPYAQYAKRAGNTSANPANVIVVAKTGGDYTSIQAAIDSIADADPDNPYLVHVAPGVYNESVTLKPHVHLQGSGQGATIVNASISTGQPASTAALVLGNHVSVRDLTVINSGSDMRYVSILAPAGSSEVLVDHVTVEARGGSSNNYAFYLTGAGNTITLRDVTAQAEDVSGTGLYNSNGSVVNIEGGKFTGSTYGIYNIGTDATLTAVDVQVLGEGSANNYGLYNSGAAIVVLH
ncbi:MAG: pectinesterase family protein, partial [Anaerolineales bacterium]